MSCKTRKRHVWVQSVSSAGCWSGLSFRGESLNLPLQDMQRWVRLHGEGPLPTALQLTGPWRLQRPGRQAQALDVCGDCARRCQEEPGENQSKS